MYIGNTLWGENGLHAFGNNSTESEPDETWNSVSQMGGGGGPGRFWARSAQ